MLFLIRLKPERGGAQVVNDADAVLVTAEDGAQALVQAQALMGGSTQWAGADFMVLTDEILTANGGHVFLRVSPETIRNWDNGMQPGGGS